MTPAPFVGLRSFQASDSDWFFGRDRETSALAIKLQQAAFTAVVGPSGSGKSSLVRAGVVPFLRELGWKEIIAKPGSAPIARLAHALALAGSDSFAEARRFRFDAALRASAFGLVRIVESLGIDTPKLLLVIDQFEELFRYGDEATGVAKAGMREESRAFVELLLTAANGSYGRLHVCVTMRSDFFGACSSYAGLAEATSLSQYLVPLPRRDQLEVTIREPVKKAGALIEEALVQRLLVDVEEEQDRLPLLQHTLRRLWEYASGDPRTMREDDYVKIGKIAGSIDRKAETVSVALVEADPVDRITLERVMKALTDLDIRGRATRRMQKRSELLALLQRPAFADPKVAAASLDRVLGALANEENSFLQLGEGEDPEVDIGHEALIRSWLRLSGPRRDFESGWLREERDDGALWRGYIVRAGEGAFLSLRERLKVSSWLSRRSLGEEWSRRYGGRWKDVNAFIARSWRRGIAWTTASAMGLILAGAAWWHQDEISFAAKKVFNIGPFAEAQIWPYVLKDTDERALQPFMSFVECAGVSMCPEMVVIPGGKFTMGSDGGLSGERPAHPVEIRKRLAVAKFELTVEQWTTCVDHGWCPSVPTFQFGGDEHPAINISWDDAERYVEWLSDMTRRKYRLLSEAEWEYVARAGTTTPYYWGNGQDIGVGNANCAQCGNDVDNQATLPVGQFGPNQFGLCDTRGNVWEFTADLTHENYIGAPSDGSPWTDFVVNRRIVRGGSYTTIAKTLTASYRFSVAPTDRYPGVGLRVARDLVDASSSEAKPAAGPRILDRQATCQFRPAK